MRGGGYKLAIILIVLPVFLIIGLMIGSALAPKDSKLSNDLFWGGSSILIVYGIIVAVLYLNEQLMF